MSREKLPSFHICVSMRAHIHTYFRHRSSSLLEIHFYDSRKKCSVLCSCEHSSVHLLQSYWRERNTYCRCVAAAVVAHDGASKEGREKHRENESFNWKLGERFMFWSWKNTHILCMCCVCYVFNVALFLPLKLFCVVVVLWCKHRVQHTVYA